VTRRMARVLDYPIKPRVHPTVAGKSLWVEEKFGVQEIVHKKHC
jgi:hypothetical protein